ncbi:MAG: hypothetical protein AB1793_08135 [Candidatus Thermoplasmatota archaeon]
MAIFLVLFALAQIVVSLGYEHFSHYGYKGRLSLPMYYGMIAGAVILTGFGIWTYLGSRAISSLGSTTWFDFTPRFLSVMVNALAVYSSQIGFIVPLAFLGIPYLLRKRQGDLRMMFLLAVLIFFIPFIGYQLYVAIIIAPYLIALGIIWLYSFSRQNRWRNLAVPLIVILVASSLVLPPLMIDRWNEKEYVEGDKVVVDPDVFNIATYCEVNYGSDPSISNAAIMKGLIGTIAGVPFSGPGLSSLLNGDITPEEVRSRIEPTSGFTPDSMYIWFRYEESLFVGYFEVGLMTQGIEAFYSASYLLDFESREYLVNHSRLVVYVDNNWPSSYSTIYADRPAVFLSELQKSQSESEYSVGFGSMGFASYMTYATHRSSVYIVQLPPASW